MWGRIRRNVESSEASAQASAADVEATRLSLQAALASDYFQLRALDAERQLFDETVGNFERSLVLTQRRYAQGVASGADVAQAETPNSRARGPSRSTSASRARSSSMPSPRSWAPPRATSSIALRPLDATPPEIPTGVPSELLERRPDVAAAQRDAAAANAQIGVAQAAYYPRLFLAASAGLQTTSLGSLFSAPSRFWSLGPSLMQTLFSGGRRRAAVDQAKASYDAAVAT